MRPALAFAALALLAPSAAGAAPRTKVAVLEIRSIAIDRAASELLSEVALTQASRYAELEVIGQSDVAALLGFEKQKRLLGCGEDRACMAEIGGALGVDYLLTGSVGRIGGLLRLDLRLVEARKARVLARFGDGVEGEDDELVPLVERGVDELLGPLAGGAPAPRANAAPAGAARPSPSRAAPPAGARRLRFNGRALSGAGLETLARLERAIGRLPDGEYWYDDRTGASGRWGGPTLAFLPPGLGLGGPLPAEASGGGQGNLTAVFINGRELHPLDVVGLGQLIGQVWPGRWWVDAQGNYGLEGGPPLGNLFVLARSRGGGGRGGGQAWSRRYEGATPRDNLNMASDGTTTCVSVSGYSRCTGE